MMREASGRVWRRASLVVIMAGVIASMSHVAWGLDTQDITVEWTELEEIGHGTGGQLEDERGNDCGARGRVSDGQR